MRRDFAGTARELALSKATGSKAVRRVEVKLDGRLLNSTSRRLALTHTGRKLTEQVSGMLAAGEAAESEALLQ